MKNKAKFLFFLFVFLFTLVIVKAFYVQVINREKLTKYSNSQTLREVKTYPPRGQIFDRNGSPLAINIKTYNIFTNPKKNENFYNSYKELARYLPKINITSLKNVKKYTYLGRKIELSDEVFEKIKNLPGIHYEEVMSRVYPNHELASHVLGFVGLDNEGLSGVEFSFNEQLRGKPVIKKFSKDAKGRPIKFQNKDNDLVPEDIILSIDKDIQANLERHLKDEVDKQEALSGGAAVMDVSTGEILAMANYPHFDPNEYAKYNPEKRKLSFITDPFEPGSIFKTFTIAAALESKVFTKDSQVYCEKGKLKIGKHIIKESSPNHQYEWLSVTNVLKNSSNIGTTKIAFELGYPILKEQLKKFNIGEKTGIEFAGESRGILDNADTIKDIKLSNISFGQGVATTPLQMLAAYASIANGGYYVKPTILKTKEKIIKNRIISQDVARDLIDMLELVVEEGTGYNAKIPHIKIAGKTSTAQRVSENGGYEGYISGFIGFPLIEKNRFAVFVYIEDPKKQHYGNTVAAPVFQKITKSILYKNEDLTKKIIPKELSKNKNLDNVRMITNGIKNIKKDIMPDLMGLDKNTVNEVLSKLDVEYHLHGYGIVKKQSLEAGKNIKDEKIINIYFEIPKHE